MDSQKFLCQIAVINNLSPPCGILMNLSDIDTIFTSNDHHTHNIAISVHPQAFLHYYGHVKANGIAASFHKILRNIKQQIGKQLTLQDD
jgi:hypothetical protein